MYMKERLEITASFRLAGQEFIALNGHPHPKSINRVGSEGLFPSLSSHTTRTCRSAFGGS